MSTEEINSRFNNELQQQIEGVLPKGHTYRLGNAGDTLQSAGIPDLPIELKASRLVDKSMQENHLFDLSEIKSLPKAIQTPLAVFRSATHIGSYVIMTEIKHKDQNYVVALQANRKEEKINVNSIRSIYPKDSRKISTWVNEGLLEYTDKQKMAEWLSKQRSNSADVKKSFNHSINIVNNFNNVR